MEGRDQEIPLNAEMFEYIWQRLRPRNRWIDGRVPENLIAADGPFKFYLVTDDGAKITFVDVDGCHQRRCVEIALKQYGQRLDPDVGELGR